jgi:hypothetical protein
LSLLGSKGGQKVQSTKNGLATASRPVASLETAPLEHETPGVRKTLSSMTTARPKEAQHQLRLHRFAVQLYETLVERYGIDHEQAKLALRLVEATNQDGSHVAVSLPSGLARD